MQPNRHLTLTSRTASRYNLRRMGIQINCHHTNTTRVLDRIRTKPLWFFWLAFVVTAAGLPDVARAQSPELSIREFSSGQIKKGVRSIGFGGDGATWGNYALVWRDAGTALFIYGDVHYTNGNDFHFVAVGATTPALWHHLAIYAIGMFQDTNDVRFSAKSPGLGANPVPLIGKVPIMPSSRRLHCH